MINHNDFTLNSGLNFIFTEQGSFVVKVDRMGRITDTIMVNWTDIDRKLTSYVAQERIRIAQVERKGKAPVIGGSKSIQANKC